MNKSKKTKLWDYLTLLLSDILYIDKDTQNITTQSGNKSPLENQYRISCEFLLDVLDVPEQYNNKANDIVKSDMVETIASVFDDYDSAEEVLEVLYNFDYVDFTVMPSQDIWKHICAFPIPFWHEKLWPLTNEYKNNVVK